MRQLRSRYVLLPYRDKDMKKTLVLGDDPKDVVSAVKSSLENKSDKVIMIDDTPTFPFQAKSGGWMDALTIAASSGFSLSPHYVNTPNPETKCGLPSCNVKTRKDYCCPEHCKQHKEMKKT